MAENPIQPVQVGKVPVAPVQGTPDPQAPGLPQAPANAGQPVPTAPAQGGAQPDISDQRLNDIFPGPGPHGGEGGGLLDTLPRDPRANRKRRLAMELLSRDEVPERVKRKVMAYMVTLDNPGETRFRAMLRDPTLPDPTARNVAGWVLDNLPAVTSGVTAMGVGMAVGTATANPFLGVAAGLAATPGAAMIGEGGRSVLTEGKLPTGDALFSEAQTQTKAEAAGAAFGGAVNLALYRPGKGLLRALGGRLLPEAAEANSILTALARDADEVLRRKGFSRAERARVQKAALAPAEATDGKILDFFDNFLSGSSFFGGARSRWVQARNEAIEHGVKNYLDAVGDLMSPAELAKMIGHRLGQVKRHQNRAVSAMHSHIARAVRTGYRAPKKINVHPGTIKDKGDIGVIATGGLGTKGGQAGLVDMRRIRETSLKDWRDWFERTGKAQVSSAQKENIERMLEGLDDLEDFKSFDDIRRWRTFLGEELDIQTLGGRKRSFGEAGGRLYDDLTREMGEALKRFDKQRKAMGFKSDTHGMWERANKASIEINERFNESFLNNFIEFASTRGHHTGKALLNEVVGDQVVDNVEKIVHLTGRDSPAMQGLRRAYLNRLTNVARMEKGGAKVFSGGRMVQDLTATHKFGERAGRALFGNEEYDRLLSLAKAIETSQLTNSSGGQMAAQFTEASVLITALTRGRGQGSLLEHARSGRSAGLGKDAAGGTIRLAFKLSFMRRAIQNPYLSNLLLKGLTTGAKTREGAAIAARLIAEATKDEVVEVNE